MIFISNWLVSNQFSASQLKALKQIDKKAFYCLSIFTKANQISFFVDKLVYVFLLSFLKTKQKGVSKAV